MTVSAKPGWTAQLTAVGAVATAIIGLLALVGAIYQLWQARVTARQTRAHQYLARYNDAAQIPYIVRMTKFISLDGTTQEARLAQWKEFSAQEKLETVHALNFWEELAGMYNRNQVDRGIVRSYFGEAAVDYWKRSKWFADFQRDVDNPRVMDQFEKMCVDIERRRPASG